MRRPARIASSTDWHCDLVTGGVERVDELRDYLDAFLAHVESTRVDIALLCGDFWDPGTVLDPKWARFTYGAIANAVRITSVVDGYVIVIPGNHDVIDSAEPLSTLSGLAAVVPRNRILVAELPVFDAPLGLDAKDVALGVLALPYVSRTVERGPLYPRAYETAMESARSYAKNHGPVVVMTHLMFEGMTPGSESEELARGRDVPFPVSDVELVRPELIVAGHYHKRQTIRRGRLDVEIVGAPMLTTFGERDDGERGFLTAEV